MHFSESDIKNWQIKAGSHYKDRSESSDQIRLIKKKSPLFNPTTNILDRDITILEVNTPFVFNNYVRPVCLPERHPRKGDNCAVVGWGSTQGNVINILGCFFVNICNAISHRNNFYG